MAENRAKQDDELAINLYNNTMTGEWWNVVEMYEKHQTKAICARINTSGDTALHVAVSIAPEDMVRKLVSEITKVSEFGLWTKNNEGNTPLHVAATTRRFLICLLLAKELKNSDVQDLVLEDLFRNNAGESPHFLAASHGQKPNFLCLQSLGGSPDSNHSQSNPFYRRKDGETILHCAIRWEHFDLAFEILERDRSLAYSVNEHGITPLHLLASKPSVFRSCCHLKFWDWKSVIYHCTWVKELKHKTAFGGLVSSAMERIDESSRIESQKSCQERIYPFWKMARAVTMRCRDLLKKKIKRGGDVDVESAKSEQEGPHAPSEAQDFQKWFSKYSDILFDLGNEILFISGYKFIHDLLKGIMMIKRKHVYSDKIMEKIMEILIERTKDQKMYFDFSSGRDPGPGQTSVVDWKYQQEPPTVQATDVSATASKTEQQHKSNGTETDSEKKENEKGKEEKIETPILLAAKNGITEMVVKILKEIPMAINDESNNIVLLAAKNRQTHVLRVLFKHDFVKRKLIHEVDANRNNALHLAAELGEQEPWVIPGAALQMQWEIKWYEFVKNNMPEHFRYQLNQDKMTPDEIFNGTHVELVKQGSEWLNKTSESCSVVAALIVTVAFAASTTIPGNIDEKIGKPNLEDRSGLSIFAYSSLIALFFSTTALFLFLSILTERYKQKDFHFKLPTRLLFGLSTLFISIVSMLVSFSAGHSFMLENKLKDKTFNVYAGLTCLPIICFFLHQLPLYIDYAMANLDEVPPSSYKAITL
ncbi:uncharacterized protein LOC126710001 [Quercus robur]|uniref:uncharacterized protein LOC126710001 n=1 Tax=Quercus robur TaxID=38942 RepID=UPI0021625092|nr:uncharacterized protein LOC126710001 [Quercus robur]